MDKELMAEYGEACIQAEIWNNKMMDLKRKIAEEMQRSKNATPNG